MCVESSPNNADSARRKFGSLVKKYPDFHTIDLVEASTLRFVKHYNKELQIKEDYQEDIFYSVNV